MSEVRVHELAKGLNLQSKELINIINGLGVEVKSHMSILEGKDLEIVIGHFRKIEAEKNKITYTLFVSANEEKKTVEIVDSLIREYYDILIEVQKNNPKIRNIEAATYAKGTDIMIYMKEFISKDEFSVLARELSSKVRKDNPLVTNIQVLAYDPYNTEKALFKENF